jgi:hypothetical protein
LLLIPFFSSYAEEASFSLKDFSGGLYSNQSGNRIPDTAVTALENYVSDVPGELIERNGYQKRDSTILGGTKAVTGLWEFVDASANQWIISFSSQSYYRNTLGNTPTKFGQNVTVTTATPDCAVNLGRIWCVNGADALWWFDGTTTGTVASAPKGTLIESWRTRLVIANISGAQSTVRFSEDGDGESWTLGGLATDPFAIQIGGANDGFNVTCLWGSYLDNFIISRKKDTWYVSGFDQEDVETRNISREIGCLQPGSIREFDGSLLFLSNRGMEEMRGITITNISEPIRNITDDLIKNTASLKSVTETDGEDWNAGTLVLDVSSSVSLGALAARTTDWTQTTAADFGSGTFDNTVFSDTITTPGSIVTTFPEGFSSYRNGTSGTKHVWNNFQSGNNPINPTTSISISTNTLKLFSTANNSDSNSGVNVYTSTPLADFRQGTTYHFKISGFECYNHSSNSELRFHLVISSRQPNGTTTIPFNFGNYFRLSIDRNGTCAAAGLKIRILNNSSDGDVSFSNAVFSATGTAVDFFIATTTYQLTITGSTHTTVWARGNHTWPACSPYAYLIWANQSDILPGSVFIDDFSVTPQTFTYTTSSYDTGITSPIWGTFTRNVAGEGSIRYTTEVSDDNVSFDSALTVSHSQNVPSARKRFIKLKAIFPTYVSPATATATQLDDFRITAGSSGTFTSQILSIGTLISSWSTFVVDETKVDGTIVYQFGSTNTTSVSAITNWQTITSGAIPTVATGSYAAFRAFFVVNSGTGSASIQSATINWNEGGATQSMASWNFDRRYWLAYTTATATSARNDRVLIYQRNRTWTIFKLPIASFATWRDKLYFGDSNDTGYVYNFDIGNTDDGSAITSILRTKSYDLGEFNRDKSFRSAYVNYLGNTGFTGSISLTYDLDRNGGTYVLGTSNMNESMGQISAKFPFPATNPIVGKEIQYTIVKSGTGDRLKLYDIRTNFSLGESD